eukprot:20877-Heterococcus_DN1.PRE.2
MQKRLARWITLTQVHIATGIDISHQGLDALRNYLPKVGLCLAHQPACWLCVELCALCSLWSNSTPTQALAAHSQRKIAGSVSTVSAVIWDAFGALHGLATALALVILSLISWSAAAKPQHEAVAIFRLQSYSPHFEHLCTDDGKHPCLTVATAAGKVMIHNPHEKRDKDARAGAHSEMRTLNINRKVTALAAGRLAADSQVDTLLVCTETNLLAYDVERNADLYFKEVPDGANAVAIGTVSASACDLHAAHTYIALFSTTHCAGSTLVLQLLYYHLLLSTSTTASWLSEACSKLAPTRMGGGDKPLAVIGGNCSIQGFDAAGEERFWTVTGDNVTSLTFADVTDSGRQDLLVGSQ